jgi:pimeloyl-ACP methyl ester carboxylesterase
MTEFVTSGDGVRIAYDRLGEGPPIVLVHGFAATRTITWQNTGWYDWLTRAGFTVIALDARGHGESDKPHEQSAYHDRIMIADILAVMDREGVPSAPIIGYSMGAYLTVGMMNIAPERLPLGILAGVGERYFTFWGPRSEIVAEGLLAEDPSQLTEKLAIEFRTFATRAKGDLKALAACMRRGRLSYTPEELGRLTHPVLVVCGEDDTIAGQAEPFAMHFAKGKAVTVPRRNHHSTVGDRHFKEAVRDFLDETL